MRSGSYLAALLAAVLTATPASAQYAELPKPLPVPVASAFGGGGWFTAATQIGRRLFVAGNFTRLSPPTGSAVVVDLQGRYVPGAFPLFAGTVYQIVADNAGGWLVVGAFVSVDGKPFAGFARVAPDRTLDERYRVVADGPIRKVALAHGRIYLVGDFTIVNGAPRRGLAALDAVSGALSPWSAGFDSRGGVRELSFSSIAVYVAGGSDPGHLWGLDAASGAVLFDRPGFVSAIAASSALVYVGGVGYTRPVWAVDPRTGQDAPWTPGLTFEYLPATYGWDATHVTALLLDGGRLYIGGRFRTGDGRTSLVAVGTSGGAIGWRPATSGPTGDPAVALFRIGPAIVASFAGAISVYDVATAARVPFEPDVAGAIEAVAAAPEGVVIGGGFNGSGGVTRAGLASIDLDTYAIEPWTSALSTLPADPIAELATDGTWLFARTEGTLNGGDARFFKIDAVTGAVVGELALPSIATRMRVAGGEIVVATLSRDVVGGVGRLAIGAWTFTALPVTFNSSPTGIDVAGDTIYLAGRFSTVSGESRPSFAALHRVTGAVLPWRPAADAPGGLVRTAGGRVWVAGEFRRVGGQRRRGLAELDPTTGAALPWNPDVSGILSGGSLLSGVHALELGGDGTLYAAAGSFPSISFTDIPERGVAAGQLTSPLVAYSTTTGRRLPWRPVGAGLVAALPDCLFTSLACLPPGEPAPTGLQVAQSGASLGFTWTLPPSTTRTGVRLEVGSAAGRADLVTLDLPAGQTAFSAAAPPGSYFARVRALAGAASSMATPDVTFAVGAAAAPLDFTAIAAGPLVTFAWQPPSGGVPTRYELEAGTAEGRRDIGAIGIAGAATTLTVNAPIGRFWTRLVAVNASGRSAVSNEAFIDNTPRFTCSTSPPQNLTATVVGRTVTLSWQLPADGSEDSPWIIAGSAPGASDLASIQAPPYVTSFSVVAPPGVYYVRLRAGCFTTAFSNEVQVVVP